MTRKRSTAKKALPPPAARRDPTKWESEAFPAAIERQAQFKEPASVRISHDERNGLVIDSPHGDVPGFTGLFSAAVGSRSEGWVRKAISDLMAASGCTGGDDAAHQERLANAALAFMTDIAPTNTVEAALAINAWSSHELSLLMMTRARKAEYLDGMQAYGNLATKLSRTFTLQIEALHKMRRGGEQIVKHVHVYEGGQAVVAGTINQHQGVGGKAKNGGQSEAANAIAGCAALPGPDAEGLALPIAGREREAALQDARRD